MTQPTPKVLTKLLKDADIAPAHLALKIGRDKDYIRDYLVGRKKSLKPNDWDAIKRELKIPDFGNAPLAVSGMPVVGIAKAGAFMDVSISDFENNEEISVARDPRFPRAEQYALKVAGDSMNKMFNDGSYVICVNWADSGMELRPDMCLHIERHQSPLVEVTLKRYATRSGKRYLDPQSTNAIHKPIEINGDDSTEIIIKGLVIGKWEPVAF